eukprot:25362_1
MSSEDLKQNQQLAEYSDDEKKEDEPFKSEWNDKLFDVEVDDEDSTTTIQITDYFDVNLKSKTRKIVYPIYILIGLSSLAMMFMGIFGDDLNSIISILSICAMTWVGALIGMMGVYVWGTVEDCIDWFKDQNNKFENNLDILRSTRGKIKSIAKDVFKDVKTLQTHSKELTKHLSAFEELRNSLEAICGDNQRLEAMLDEINDQYKDLVHVISQNERASLLSIYYEVSILDRDEGLSKKEYKKFLGRLNNKTKALFLEEGDFDALDLDDSGTLDLEEFERILDDVIAKQEKLTLQHYMQ